MSRNLGRTQPLLTPSKGVVEIMDIKKDRVPEIVTKKQNVIQSGLIGSASQCGELLNIY